MLKRLLFVLAVLVPLTMSAIDIPIPQCYPCDPPPLPDCPPGGTGGGN